MFPDFDVLYSLLLLQLRVVAGGFVQCKAIGEVKFNLARLMPSICPSRKRAGSQRILGNPPQHSDKASHGREAWTQSPSHAREGAIFPNMKDDIGALAVSLLSIQLQLQGLDPSSLITPVKEWHSSSTSSTSWEDRAGAISMSHTVYQKPFVPSSIPPRPDFWLLLLLHWPAPHRYSLIALGLRCTTWVLIFALGLLCHCCARLLMVPIQSFWWMNKSESALRC